MSLEDCRAYMLRCSRCSYCKWIPFDHIKSWRFSKGCPSIEYGKFQSYSAGGRLVVALALLDQKISYTEGLMDIVYKCQMDGLCEISDKICRYDIEILKTMRELRFKLVEDGQFVPEHMLLIENLRKEDNMMFSRKADRGKWAEGLNLKEITREKAEVLFHAGCRYSYDEELQKVARTAVELLTNAGVDVGIMGKDESCCGGRAYDIGFKGEFIKFAENNIEAWKTAGVKTVVVSCADCRYAFSRLYPELGSKFEVVHTLEYIDRLIKQGKIKLTKSIPIKVTYHDPCHLGRMGEPYSPWSGKEKKVFGQMVVHEPKKPRYNGAMGIYDAPREILKRIPGIELIEMERIREYAWCCGAGGGVLEAFPEYSLWTAGERIEEAVATGAEAIVTACGWCERNFTDAIKENNQRMQVYDIVELVQQAI